MRDDPSILPHRRFRQYYDYVMKIVTDHGVPAGNQVVEKNHFWKWAHLKDKEETVRDGQGKRCVSMSGWLFSHNIEIIMDVVQESTRPLRRAASSAAMPGYDDCDSRLWINTGGLKTSSPNFHIKLITCSLLNLPFSDPISETHPNETTQPSNSKSRMQPPQDPKDKALPAETVLDADKEAGLPAAKRPRTYGTVETALGGELLQVVPPQTVPLLNKRFLPNQHLPTIKGFQNISMLSTGLRYASHVFRRALAL